MKRITAVMIFLALAMVPVGLPAQETAQPGPASPSQAEPQHFYRLNLVVKELDETGKAVNSRNYLMTVATETSKCCAPQIIKTGSRIPIATGTSSNPATTQFQYIDLGVNLDVRNVKDSGDSLRFGLRAEISSVARQTQVAGTGEPVIRQNSWDSDVVVPIGKPTVVGSSDDLDSKGKTEIEVTATRID
jgi:hypothetical protein